MKREKRYIVKKSTTFSMIVLTVICIILHIILNLQFNYKDNISEIEKTVYMVLMDVSLVIASILGTNLLVSILVEVNSKSDDFTHLMTNEVFASPAFYNNMDTKKKEQMCKALERNLYFKNDVLCEMYEYIRSKLTNTSDSYYYTECTYSVTCTIYSTYIEKEIIRTTKIRSYKGAIAENNFSFGTFTLKEIEGLKSLQIKEIKIDNNLLPKHDYVLINDETTDNLDKQNEYNSTINCVYSNTLTFNDNESKKITMHYITRVPNDDRIMTFRVGYACKSFSIYFTIKNSDIKYRIFVAAYGFLDDANNSNNTDSKTDVTVKFDNWIYKCDGVTLVILDK